MPGVDGIPEHHRKLITLSRQGLTVGEIAERVGLSRDQVVSLRGRYGVSKYRRRNFTPEEKQRMADMLDDGASLGEVSRTIGRPRQSISRVFPGRGWTPLQGVEFQRMMLDPGLSFGSADNPVGGRRTR